MIRRLVLLAACCACDAPVPVADAPAVHWVYRPAAPEVWRGASAGRIGRAQGPTPIVELGVTGDGEPLHLATPWQVPGDGPARVVLYGSEGDHPAVELIDIDKGTLVWRDRKACAGPIVGVTGEAIVCADASGTRAIGLDGKPRWHVDTPFVAMTEDRVVTAAVGEAVVLDAAAGTELARVKLPAAIASDTLLASCGDAGRELFATARDGKLVRIAEAKGGPAIAWSAGVGTIVALEPCEGTTVLAIGASPAGTTITAIARETGKVTGQVTGVRGYWPARDGSALLEIATADGIGRYARDLAAPPELLPLPVLGPLLASRGDRRLVRATPGMAAVLDRDGVRIAIPLAAMGAALGDRAVVTASWLGSPGETVHRYDLPFALRAALRVVPPRPGVALAAELRDLPPLHPLELGGAVAQRDTGMHAIALPVLDPRDGAAVYAIALDTPDGEAAVARADLAAKKWRWQRVDGCAAGTPVGLVVARDVVACAVRGKHASVRATSRDGVAAWSWEAETIDRIAAAGDAVLVHAAGRAIVLDAATGRVCGELASGDGGPVRAALVVAGDTTFVVTAESGRVVARLPLAGLLAVWSLEVRGVVRAVSASSDGALIELEDGDAYRVDARTGAHVALPGLGLDWQATGEIVTGHTVGGPIPGPAPPFPPPPPAAVLRRPLQILRGELDTPPPMSTPIKLPPALGDAWQLTLYELTGGLRARNDYALAAPVVAAPRGPAGSPIVIAHGPNLRDVLVVDPRTGDPVRRVHLPDDAPTGSVFGTVVDGTPVAGAVLAQPLRFVLF